MKADPDSFVIIDNLKEYLRHCNSSEPNLYGHALYSKLESMPYFNGFFAAGEAVVLTRQALVQLATRGIDDQCFPNGTGSGKVFFSISDYKIINNNDKGPLVLAFDIRTCFTLLYIVPLFLTFTDARGENHELIFLSIP